MGALKTNPTAGRMEGCVFSSSAGKSAMCLKAPFYEKYIITLYIHILMLERLKSWGKVFFSYEKMQLSYNRDVNSSCSSVFGELLVSRRLPMDFDCREGRG